VWDAGLAAQWGGRRLALRFCDTSGEMEDRVTNEEAWPWGFANVDLFLCCFDVTSLESLRHVQTKWGPLVRKLCLDVPIVRRQNHLILFTLSWAKEHGLRRRSCAASRANISTSFRTMAGTTTEIVTMT
jgi:GTPase SAR1 family protein